VSTQQRIEQSASFVAAGTGHRLRLISSPVPDRATRGTIVFVHGFAEEMNKSRRMVARMARLLAADGWCVVQRDLDACGDSSGDFGEASWSSWIDDVRDELARAPRERSVWVWCMRAGALLASSVIASRPDANLLLWQPVLSGAQHLQQFLRLQAAARIAGSEPAMARTSAMATLRSGEAVWVGGYQVNPALAHGLEHARFDVPDGHRGRIVWLEVSQDEQPTISPSAERAIAELTSRGLTVEASAVAGPPFWQTLEIEDCEPLLAATSAAIRIGAAPLVATDPRGERVDSNAAATPRSTSGDVVAVVAFQGRQGRLWGVLSRPHDSAAASTLAVLVVVGGPQYRAGSHRQFVSLARRLAKEGFATLRFDYAGMGDSEGEKPDFLACGPDLAAALTALMQACPRTTRVAVWGLCDAASAAFMFATADDRVHAIVAANPWARSASSLAAARVKHYYLARMGEREFWAKVAAGRLHWRVSFRSLLANVHGMWSHGREISRPGDSYQMQMARGLSRFRGRVLLILSGRDLTAREFLDHVDATPAWKDLLVQPRVSRVDLADADHTFSRPAWQRAVEEHTVAWLRRLDSDAPAASSLAAAVAR
jgi:exosortase A-associated hydrolase 1/exosortase A-associated hydrolase 2